MTFRGLVDPTGPLGRSGATSWAGPIIAQATECLLLDEPLAAKSGGDINAGDVATLQLVSERTDIFRPLSMRARIDVRSSLVTHGAEFTVRHRIVDAVGQPLATAELTLRATDPATGQPLKAGGPRLADTGDHDE